MALAVARYCFSTFIGYSLSELFFERFLSGAQALIGAH
jgi:hypothetical protein